MIVEGDLDISNLEEFKTTFTDLLESDPPGLVISLEDTRYFDSRTVQTLMQFNEKMHTQRQLLVLVSPTNPSASKLMKITGLDLVVKAADTLEEAQALIKTTVVS
jgi:anti-anti-sigma factor